MSQSIAAGPTASPLPARPAKVPPANVARPEQADPACPHGLRPGTTVCLHCLREKRLAIRQRRYKTAARVGLAIVGGGLLIVLAVGTVKSIAPTIRASRAAAPATPVATAPAARSSRSRPVRWALQPAVAVGRTDLGQGMFVERIADSIFVRFDTDTLRTRFDWKFEGVVRATLPTVFPQLQTQLDSIPQATLVRGGSLLRDLPHTGIRFPVDATHALTIWPITRPGQDGPLVVGYRISPTR
jgi:hypothetical protein